MNNYPILAPQNTWFAPNVSAIKRANITEIEIMDSYTPDASTTVTDSWDASSVQDNSIICYVIGTKLIIAGNGNGKIAMNENAKQAFSYNSDWSDCFSALTKIVNANLLDLSNTSNIGFLFYDCKSLTTIDVSNWNTSNIQYMGCVFYGCTALTSIDVDNWDVSNVKEIYSLFDRCEALQSLNLSKWNFKHPLSFRQTFNRCTSLTTIGDVSNWNITISHMEGMFSFCSSLKNIYFGTLTLEPSNENALRYVFSDCLNITSIKIKQINIIGDILISMTAMFQNCKKLSELELLKMDFSKVSDMSFMLYSCSALKEIDVSNWNVSNVTNFDHFAAHALLRRKGIENWDTSSAINMNAMFHNCAEEELDLSGFKTDKVQFFCQMFENSPNLKHIKGLDKWNTSNVVGFDEMFGRCPKLEELDLSGWDTSKAKSGVKGSTNGHTTGTFRNFCNDCQNLKWIRLGSNFAVNGDGTNTNAEYKLILPTPSADYIEGADGKWYIFTGQDYAPNAIPDRTYNTYYASEDLIRDLNVRVNNGTILDIVEAVREKVPDLEPILLSDLDDVIKNI